MPSSSSAVKLNEIQLKIVDMFRFDYDSASLNNDIARVAPNESTHSRFLIKMEIARLSKKCRRILDLRDVQSDWMPFVYDGIQHFVNDATAREFLIIARKYKGYTQGTFELIFNKVQAKAKSERYDPASIEAPLPDYISLTSFHKRKEQRLYFVSPIQVFSLLPPMDATRLELNKLAYNGQTTDISQFGLCIKLKGIELNKSVNEIYIRFVGFEKDFKSNTPIIVKYEIISSSSKQINYYYRIKLCESGQHYSASDFNLRLLKFIHAQLRRYRVPIDNTQEAVKVKGFEQYMIGSMNVLPLFLKFNDNKWVPSAVFSTHENASVLRKLTDPQNGTMLVDLICQQALQKQIQLGIQFSEHYVLAPVNTPEHFAKFILIPLWQCYNDPIAASIAQLAYERTPEDLILFRIDGVTINPEQEGFIPCSLPDSTKELFQLINIGTQERSSTLGAGYQRMISITDESVLIDKLFIFKQKSDGKIPKGGIFDFIPKKASATTELHIVKDESEDRRKEERFLYKLPITISAPRLGKEQVNATTIDISSLGLRVQSPRPLKLFVGDNVSVDFKELSNLHGDPIIRQNYQVAFDKGNITQLVIKGARQHHIASKAITQLIKNNLNALGVAGCRDEVHGLSRVIRNLYAYNFPHPVIYIKKRKKQRYISDIAISNNTILPEFSIHNEENKLIVQTMLQNEFFVRKITQSWSELRGDVSEIKFIILVTFKESPDGNGYQFTIKDADELLSKEMLQNDMMDAISQGDTKLLLLTFQRKSAIFNRYYSDELAYLSRYAPNRAILVEDLINKVEATGYVVDITSAFVLP